MEATNLTPDVIQTLFDTINELRAEVADLKASRAPTPSRDGNMPPPPPLPVDPVSASKSEKFPDPPMFNGTRKELRPFITKLRLKLERNADRFPTDADKVSYGISRLEGDAAITIDPFYRNGTLPNLSTLISLLEMTYDDVSRKYTALTKLEACRQKNREFTSFYSEFLALMGELNWNEDAKIAALRRAISNEVRGQLVGRELPPTLSGFASLCQRIDEDLRLNQASRYKSPNAQRTMTPRNATTTNQPVAPARDSLPAGDPMDLDAASAQQYAPAGSDERKKRTTEGKCFGCGKKGHLHRDCPTNPYSKIRRTAETNLRENAQTPLRVASPRIMPSDESENESS